MSKRVDVSVVVVAGLAALGCGRSEEGAFDGYTLIAPYLSTSTYLIDMAGQVVHRWESDETPAGGAYLLDDGRLLRCADSHNHPEGQCMLTWRISFASLESHLQEKRNPPRVRNSRRWYDSFGVPNHGRACAGF